MLEIILHVLKVHATKSHCCGHCVQTDQMWCKLGPEPNSQKYTVDSETGISKKKLIA